MTSSRNTGQQDHPAHPHEVEPQVHGEEGADGGQVRLPRQELGLHQGVGQGDYGVQSKQRQAPVAAQQQGQQGPGDQHRPHPKHRQGVHQGGEGGGQQGVVQAHPDESGEKDGEGQEDQQQLRP